VPEPNWEQANCRTHDPEMFFPLPGRMHKNQRLEAKDVCRGKLGGQAECPVREACRDYALTADFEAQGIWGGLSDRERRRFAKNGYDPVSASREVASDDGLHADDKGRDKSRRPNRADAAGRGRGAKSGRETTGRPARKRASKARVLPARRLSTNHGCSTARGVGEDAVAGDLRGGPRRPRKVAAMGTTSRSSVRAVALRSMRVAMDGDVA
jgi:WhiB family transcriptional regulator, redox-sensing transcriptional regulator